jgi:hypothetical protein
VSSTTIRYFGVPENSHSREPASNQSLDADSYATARRSSDQPESRPTETAQYTAFESDLTAKWRNRITETASGASDPVPSDSLPVVTAGTAGPITPDPRHNPAYPHPKNPGLSEEPDGFYDWAGRRLFLSDGAPDPMTPGAYRYQTRPDLCLLDAADDDPWSPLYEPDHLRHKPGDDWIIDQNRPYDVLDPGPFGSPGWFPDRRTGRHRRDELPDPIPWWEIEEEPLKAEWAENAEALYDRRTRITREREAREAAHAARIAEPDPATKPAARQVNNAAARTADRPDTRHGPDDDSRGSGGPGGPTTGSGPVRDSGRDAARDPSGVPVAWRVAPDRPSPERPRRERFRTDEEAEPTHRFTRLQEQAWDRFLIESEALAAAHTRPIARPISRPSAIERECGPHIAVLYRLFHWLAWLFASFWAREPIGHEDSASDTAHDSAPDAGLDPEDRSIPVRAARHTEHAARAARFARAVGGAQRARATRPAPQAGPQSAPATGRQPVPCQDRRPGPETGVRPGGDAAGSQFIAEWEQQFSIRAHLQGGPAWA